MRWMLFGRKSRTEADGEVEKVKIGNMKHIVGDDGFL